MEPGRYGSPVAEHPELLAQLDRWAAGARAGEAGEARVRERWLRRQAAEESTMAGLLELLAGSAATVTLATRSGRTLRGRVIDMGNDFVALAGSPGSPERLVLVTLGAIASLTEAPAAAPERSGPPGPADGRGVHGVNLVDLLAQASAHRPLLRMRNGAATVVGELHSIGADVAVMRSDDPTGAPVYVSLAGVEEVSFLGSG